MCDITHEWVPYPFCVIAMCNSYKRYESQFALCEQFHKIAFKKSQSHSHNTSPYERAFSRDQSTEVFPLHMFQSYALLTELPRHVLVAGDLT